MKRAICVFVCMILLVTMLPFCAMAETDARVQCYNNLKLMGQLLSGVAPEKEIVDETFGSMLALVIVEGKSGQPGYMQAIGPNAEGESCTITWNLTENPDDSTRILRQIVSLWDAIVGKLEDGALQLLYLSDRLSNGVVILRSQEDVAALVSATDNQVYTPESTETTVATQPTQQATQKKDTKPVLPSIDSFAGYRLSYNPNYDVFDDPCERFHGFANKALAEEFAEDYVKLLTDKYHFKLIKVIDMRDDNETGTYASKVIYYLDYAGNRSALRPVTYQNLSADVIVYLRVDGNNSVHLFRAEGLDCQETNDRTTVNIQNR